MKHPENQSFLAQVGVLFSLIALGTAAVAWMAVQPHATLVSIGHRLLNVGTLLVVQPGLFFTMGILSEYEWPLKKRLRYGLISAAVTVFVPFVLFSVFLSPFFLAAMN